ncbi:MAG TPA: ATP-binding protein [Phycisphaerae bacterium]|nr:ATP-binding protein [Phycisphaerae bacterium]
MLSLYVLQGPDKGRRFDIPDGDSILLGRSSEHLPLTDLTVSRKHARLEHTRDGWSLVDAGSANGVFINGIKINGRGKLRIGDQIRMGSTLLVFGSPTQSVTVAPGANVDARNVSQPGDSAIISTVPSSDDSVILAAPEPSAAAMAHFRVLLQVATALSAIFDVNEILNRVMDIVFEQLRADRGFIGLLSQNGGSWNGGGGERPMEVEPRVVRFRDDEEPTKIAVSQTIIQHVLEKKEGVLSSNAMTDQRFTKGKSVHNLSIRSAICVPIKGRDRILGVIDIDSLVANFSYTGDQLRLLTAIGLLTGMAIENTRLYQENVQKERLAATGETVASLSHSIKNILQGISGGAEVVEIGLKKGDLEHVRTGWRMLQRNLDKVQGLTLNMLAYSKPRKPTLELTHLPHVLQDCVDLVRGAAEDKEVVLLTEMNDSVPPIPVDADGLHQAVLNLLVNAIDAVPAKTGVVSLSIEYDPGKQDTVIEVQDNGVGISPEDQKKMFTPFFSTKGQRGTGLGLAVTKKIVEEHGGRIELKSELGQGTRFRLHFPMGSVPPADQTHGPR